MYTFTVVNSQCLRHRCKPACGIAASPPTASLQAHLRHRCKLACGIAASLLRTHFPAGAGRAVLPQPSLTHRAFGLSRTGRHCNSLGAGFAGHVAFRGRGGANPLRAVPPGVRHRGDGTRRGSEVWELAEFVLTMRHIRTLTTLQNAEVQGREKSPSISRHPRASPSISQHPPASRGIPGVFRRLRTSSRKRANGGIALRPPRGPSEPGARMAPAGADTNPAPV